jgi:hypothetical protein
MGILRLKPRGDTETVVGPAQKALAANIARAVELQQEAERLVDLDTQVMAARANAAALVNAPVTFRTQLATAEVAILAEAELSGAMVDATTVENLRIQLEEAERLAGPAATRVAVETAKHDRLQAQLDALRDLQRQVQAEHATVGEAALWEDLEQQITELTARRTEFVHAFDKTFSTARAIDILAEALRTGRFAGAHAARDLVLPVVEGMPELAYSQAEHLQRIEKAAVSILQGLGLHA